MAVKKITCIPFLVLAIVLFGVETTSAAKEYTYINISTATGLSQNDVRCIHQDSRGYVWIATHDGINCHEGSDYKIYRMGDRGLTTSLTMSIAEDHRGDLWVWTLDKGLFKYDAKADYFLPIRIHIDPKYDLGTHVSSIIVDADDQLWIGGGNVICKLMAIEGKPDEYKAQEYTIANLNDIRFMDCDDRGVLTVISQRVVYQYDKVQDEFRRYFNLENIAQIQWQKGKIYVIMGEIPHLFNPVNHQLEPLSDIPTWMIKVSSKGVLWSCGSTGIYQVDLTLPSDHPERTTMLAEKGYMINSLIEDSFGNIWMGAYRKGILLVSENFKPFRTVQKESSIENIYEDHYNQVWAGSVFGELTLYKDTSLTDAVQVVLDKRGARHVIHCIREHRQSNKMFIGSEDGLFVADSRRGDYTFRCHPISRIYNVLEDSSYLWICTHNQGLILFDAATETKIRELPVSCGTNRLRTEVIRSAMKDSNDNIWVGTGSGLVVLPAKERFSPRPAFRPVHCADTTVEMTQISQILEIDNSEILVGTHGQGLFRLSAIDSNFNCKISHYDTHSGLSNNTIKGILKNHNDDIWVSTNKGLNSINLTSGRITTFSTKDGLQDYAFCDFSCAQLSNGDFVFGGVRGMNTFDSEKICRSTIEPTAIITDFQLGNEVIHVGERVDGRVILSERLSDNSSICLKWHQNNFSILFSALHYLSSQDLRFMYRLQGYDKEWTFSSQNQSARYTNLAPGEYVFELKATLDNEHWSESLSVHIQIQTPIWYRWYSCLFYLLCLVLVVRHFFKDYVRRQKEKNDLLLIKRESQYLQKLSQIKMNFFTEVSHEFRTPLTLIMSPLQTLISQKNLDIPARERLMQIMAHNSSILMRLVNQTLSLAKHDNDKLTPYLKRADFNAFSKAVFTQFYPMAIQRNIEMHYFSSKEMIEINFDPHMMEEVVYNLVSNAIKHTPERGMVSCDITEEQDEVAIRISDSGHGIDEQVKAHIFERFYTNPDATVENQGIGIGLPLVKCLVELHGGTIDFITSPEQGTTFILRIPKNLNQDAHSVATDERETEYADERCQIQSEDEPCVYEQPEQTTILVVDDNRGILELLAALLSPSYRVITALNGREGVEKCIKEMPTLVVTDVIMPVMDGVELCRQIKGNKITSHIPIVMLTAKGSKEGQTEGFNALVDAYCLKPFDNHILLSTIESIIINRRNLALRFSQDSIVNSANNAIALIDNEFMQSLIKIIDEHLSNPALNIELICAKIGIGQIALNKKLKKTTNLTTNLFIRHIKMKRAAELLSMGCYTVAEVTYAVGLNDLKYFRECFRKEFGINPSDYGKESQSASKDMKNEPV